MTCRCCGASEPYEYYLLTLVELLEEVPSSTGGYPRQLVLEQDGSAVCSVLFHPDCYDELLADVLELYKDVPAAPASSEDVFECTCCGSGVRLHESFVNVEYGVLRPALQRGAMTYLQQSDYEGALCLSCANQLGERAGVVDLLAVAEGVECEQCRLVRCWRQSYPPCVCDCHRD